MNVRAFCVTSLAALCCAGAAIAGAPLPGNYQSTDLGGPIAVGRHTEGWATGGGAMLAGTTLTGQSWNGSALGTEWKYWCATEALPAVLQSDYTDAHGTGSRTWKKTFAGGYLWLSGGGHQHPGDRPLREPPPGLPHVRDRQRRPHRRLAVGDACRLPGPALGRNVRSGCPGRRLVEHRHGDAVRLVRLQHGRSRRQLGVR